MEKNKRYIFAIAVLEIIVLMAVAFHVIALEKRISYAEGKINCLYSALNPNSDLKDISIACATINTGY